MPDPRDLDETRRLLYMVALARRTPHYELAATLVNAICHHQGAGNPDDVADRIVRALDGGGGRKWLRRQIRRCSG